MARNNPYAMDPNLMQGFSNLTRALIGSAADDAALARAEASKAAANASNARAGLYGSQQAGVDQTNAMNKELYAAGNALAADPAFQSQIAQALGLDTMASSYVGPPAPGQIRLGTENANTMARTALGTYGNAEQMTGAFNNVGEGADSSLARSMILNGTDNQAGRGALMLSPGGGKYQNPGFAMTELQTQDATNRRDDDLDSADARYQDDLQYGPGGQGDRDTAADNAQLNENNKRDNDTARREDDLRFGEGGQGDRDTAAQERWEKYKSDKDTEAKKYDTDKDDSLARWQHENRDIEISVEPGKQIVVNPAAGQLLGIQPNQDGLYILDGGPKPGALTIKVGKEDVYLTEEDAKRLGIEKNDDGQYVIPGNPALAPKNSKSGSGSGGGDGSVGTGNTLDMTRYQDQWSEDYERYGDPDNPLPNHAIGGMNVLTQQMIERDTKENPELGVNAAYSRNVIPVISAGSYIVKSGGRDFNVPNYFVQYFSRMPEEQFKAAISGGNSQFRRLWTQTMRYNDDQYQRIVNEILKLRQS